MNTEKNFNDYLPEYKTWLQTVKNYKSGTISSRVSNIKTINESYNILREFSIDECQSILADLELSKSDVEPNTSIIIKGDYYAGLATYRQALRLFICFLKDIGYVAKPTSNHSSAIFIGNFDDFKRFIGPKCRNDVNIFCKSEREKHNKICEYRGKKAELQSAHIKDRPIIIKELLDQYYEIGPDHYEVDLETFIKHFKDAHMPIKDHIFFLCKECHDMLDKTKSITESDIQKKRNSSI